MATIRIGHVLTGAAAALQPYIDYKFKQTFAIRKYFGYLSVYLRTKYIRTLPKNLYTTLYHYQQDYVPRQNENSIGRAKQTSDQLQPVAIMLHI